MSEFLRFLWGIAVYWPGPVTGGLLALVLFFAEKILRWKIPRDVYVAVVLLGLLVATFLVWRDEYREKTHTEVELAKREGEIAELRAHMESLQAAAQRCPPSGASPHAAESLTVSLAPVAFTKSRFHPQGARPAIAAQVSVEGGPIRYSDEREQKRSDPGLLFWVCGAAISRFRAVRGGQVDAVLHVTYFW